MQLLETPARALRIAVGLPGRVVRLVEDAEDLLAQTRIVVAAAAATTADAAATVGSAHAVTQDAAGMVAQVQPELQRILPLLEKFAKGLSAAEVEAAIRLVDELPTLTRSLREDVLPILGTLDRVGPDINELLHVMDDVRRAVLGIPGFAFFKRRGEEILEEQPAEPDDTPSEPNVRRDSLALAATFRP
ncbi:hypothetical protein GCM10009547_06870 [Sporichthya brevicatena]|uniref:Uncharacterized protein n=1 Tax=Sporichthya brevicatena TaxID=171442 RepID=A0ABN1GAU7_9ACTN